MTAADVIVIMYSDLSPPPAGRSDRGAAGGAMDLMWRSSARGTRGTTAPKHPHPSDLELLSDVTHDDPGEGSCEVGQVGHRAGKGRRWRWPPRAPSPSHITANPNACGCPRCQG